MSDRRRINGPGGPTNPPVYDEDSIIKPVRTRNNNDVRPFYLKTGVTPSASGSAYLEIDQSTGSGFGMKFTCTVHGPRSLPRSAPFSPHMVISTHVKYAPFATRQRRGYLRDASERDLSIHLETALRGAVIADRWPKSGVEVVVTIVEGDVTRQTTIDEGLQEWNTMSILSGCITVASAAIADAGIDSVDVAAGGVAALVQDEGIGKEQELVVDPAVSEHKTILAACCVAYLPARNEITNLWYKGSLCGSQLATYRSLVGRAVLASKGAGKAISVSLNEAALLA
ncbi:3'-5'-exoribonuclease [Metarhizium acridum]|uniref:3' exoribonuclease n=1 Tax=Metarhizium acridum (strain CQMa 102) TaxID=655827 RepID=E9EHE3_METAQ|nr:3' exoribonuclease [Metarhizium acridum CQMa 102]EFY84660.1 3' exoribonuclease [Metarhizium acridum CQMa 102]KAG8417848.1 3'-5'-exoribonuclease [Metarhizium acridum]KAG8428141.1 3'-5'-exoribonuclease [Metarhizium acridum]